MPPGVRPRFVTTRKRTASQGELPFRPRGGKRPGAGRKPTRARPGVSHGPRPPLASRFPVLVTLRMRAGLPSLRQAEPLRELRAAFSKAAKEGFRIVHFSVQSNHLHLLVEARDRIALARGMQGFAVRTARALDVLWRRKGPVLDDHYHARILRTPREVRNALVYVLANARKHGCAYSRIDPFSSGPGFDGWRGGPAAGPGAALLPASPRTWLLRDGWKRHGLIDPRERPRASSERPPNRRGVRPV